MSFDIVTHIFFFYIYIKVEGFVFSWYFPPDCHLHEPHVDLLMNGPWSPPNTHAAAAVEVCICDVRSWKFIPRRVFMETKQIPWYTRYPQNCTMASDAICRHQREFQSDFPCAFPSYVYCWVVSYTCSSRRWWTKNWEGVTRHWKQGENEQQRNREEWKQIHLTRNNS